VWVFLKNFITFFILIIPIVTYADVKIEKIVKELNLNPVMKASIQWERVFSSEHKKAEYKIDTLSTQLQEELKIYLIKHAADSEQPMLPGT
jgi:hypothetical protein